MPWVRIDENAMDHPKFVAISAGAWRLWCEGMTYCQKHLTDGFLPALSVKGMRYYSAAAVKLLVTALVPQKGPLWHATDGGYQVHDYHDWNDSRDRVLERRQEAKARMDKIRGRSPSGSREQTSEQSSERTPSTPLHTTPLPRSKFEREQTSGPDARSKRPIFKGQRFVVFEWMLDDLRMLLGEAFETFDVHAWLHELDAKAVADGATVPQRDGGKWLQAQTLAEFERRSEAKKPAPVDWWDECKRLHDGACEERMRHHVRMGAERLKAEAS